MSGSILFYDIASPVGTYAPNPWKTRYALNYKGVSYKTEWVALPAIPEVRKQLGLSAIRKFMDGSDFYTLPIIVDAAKDNIHVGDSYDIALYLDQAYPDLPTLMPANTADFHKSFNAQVDAVFTSQVVLGAAGLPFDPATAAQSKAEFARRAGVPSFDVFILDKETRVKLMEEYKKTLTEFSKQYLKRSEGPYFQGAQVTYADFIVGGWLQMLSIVLPREEWDQVAAWDDGLWGSLHQALQKYAKVK